MPRFRRRQPPNFTDKEIDEMEDLYKELGEETLCQKFCETLAKKFSRATGHSRKPSIQWEQVKAWFEKKQQMCKSEILVEEEEEEEEEEEKEPGMVSPKKEWDAAPYASISNSTPETSVAPKVEHDEQHSLSGLQFEAKSLRDDAWYDVGFFLSHRVLNSTGEPQVRVRYAGFGAEEDEWVSMKTGVRERSIPLESNECHKVNVGDLVLCFQVKEDQELYYDAHVLEIEKQQHDIQGCRCLFVVRYEHDSTEEKVQLRRICRRPSS